MIEHPAWCDRQDCATRSEHRSTDVRANITAGDSIGIHVVRPGEAPQDPADAEQVIVRARLVSLVHDGRSLPPRVELLAYDDPADAENSAAMLTVRQASMLSTGLSKLVALVGGAA